MFICQKILGPIHRTTASILKQVASAYLKLNKRGLALEYLKQAEIIYEEDKKSFMYAEVCMQIARAEQGIGRAAVAIEYAEKAARVWTEPDMIIKCWQISLDENEKLDNFENAMLAINSMEKFLAAKGTGPELFEFLVVRTLKLIIRRFGMRLTQNFYKLYVALEERVRGGDVDSALARIRERIGEEGTTIPKFIKFILSDIIQSIHLIFTGD
jgi:hypothetical protein